jgi:hypothetical protein
MPFIASWKHGGRNYDELYSDSAACDMWSQSQLRYLGVVGLFLAAADDFWSRVLRAPATLRFGKAEREVLYGLARLCVRPVNISLC